MQPAAALCFDPATDPFAGTWDPAVAGGTWSDCGAALGVDAIGTDHLGVGRVWLKSMNQGSMTPICLPFLRCFLDVGAGWEPITVTRRECVPGGWIEHGLAGRHQLRAEISFTDVSTLTVALSVEGDGDGKPRLAVVGAVHGANTTTASELREGVASLAIDRTFTDPLLKRFGAVHWRLRLMGERALVGGFVRMAMPTLPPAESVQAIQAADATTAWWLELPVTAAASGWRSVLTTTWAFDAAAPVGRGVPDSLAAARRRWQERLDRLPRPTPDTPFWRRKLAQAAKVVGACATRAPGYGNCADAIGIPATVIDWSSSVWFWNHCLAATLLPPDEQISALSFHLRHTSRGRMAPGILLAFPAYGETELFCDCYAPIASWTLLNSWRMSGVRPNLAAIYPLLEAFHQRWFEVSDRDGDGLPEWRNSGNPADDPPLYDRYAPKPGIGCFPLPPLLSVSMLSYLLMDARCLAEFAGALGLAADVARHRAQADRLEKVLLERMWDPEALTFWDLTPEGDPMKIRTFFGLLPLWAGVRLPEAVARQAVDRLLLDPAAIGGEVPFPSVARDEPTYESTGYWRGRAWPHTTLWNCEILSRYGSTAEADHLRDRVLRCYAAWNHLPGNWPGDARDIHKPGMPNYTWGAAALVHFLTGWHHSWI